MSTVPEGAKQDVKEFWNEASCGEDLYLSSESREGYEQQAARRYELEPYIVPFADFTAATGRKVLEIGVGLGADHQRFAAAGAELCGVDLTERAVAHTQRRLESMGLHSDLRVGDAENLGFAAATFDIVYSWGVLHHSPDTPAAIGEVWRVLKPGGIAKVMIYHKWSMIGVMLWLRYGLLAGRPFIGFKSLYGQHLESPGTKAYTMAEAHDLFRRYTDVHIETVLTHGDLLESAAGQRHRGMLLNIARALWPRWLIRRLLPQAGLFMLIAARKP